ncbi:hypothetical protein [Candidatus Cyanaurora vandensis]|uniref:hypothetical protein n=1 Tax=Candidatus Cyanaurora vandensis TaxID=2714958 RepID=UPI00257E7719|nr:hypothetical protein [Candidatus Cyanaurora vandensis]
MRRIVLLLALCTPVAAQDLPPGLEALIKQGVITQEEALTLYPSNLTPEEVRRLNERYAPPPAPVVTVAPVPVIPPKTRKIAPITFKPLPPLPKLKRLPVRVLAPPPTSQKAVPAQFIVPPPTKLKAPTN